MVALRFIYLFLLLLVGFAGRAQDRENGVRHYATQQRELAAKQSGMLPVDSLSHYERIIHEFHRRGQIGPITIPVVFHVLYQQGSTSYPSELDVYEQLQATNEDFNLIPEDVRHPAYTNEGFLARSSSAEISFCLAKTDYPSGATSPINFYPVSTSKWYADDAMKSAATGGASPWPTDRFLNVWVVDLEEGVSGYAQMPGGSKKTDGVVIDAALFGLKDPKSTPYSLGKTLTHLFGSYLGLYELWNENEACADDYIDDTPVHNAPNYGEAAYRHVSTCMDNPVEMTMNYMDNSDDAHLAMFTLGQVTRMHAVLSKKGPRKKLRLESSEACDYELQDLKSFAAASLEQENVSHTLRPDMQVFPSPTKDRFLIQLEGVHELGEEGDRSVHIQVFNSLGSLYFEQHMPQSHDSSRLPVDCRDWPSGTYIVTGQIGGFKISRKLIKAGY